MWSGAPAVINYYEEEEGEVRFVMRQSGVVWCGVVVPPPRRYQSVSITQQQAELLRFKRENILNYFAF